MILKFHPARGAMPKWPGKFAGAYPYIGRTFDAETRQNRATKEPAECRAFDALGKMTDEARRLGCDHCKRDGSLLPADEATAKFCGVPFVRVEQDEDGEWVHASPKSAHAKGAASKKDGE